MIINSWNDATKGHPTGARLLVVKHYLDQEFDMEQGGYRGPCFKTPSMIVIDISFREHSWEGGGIVTHWMEIPEIPDPEIMAMNKLLQDTYDKMCTDMGSLIMEKK